MYCVCDSDQKKPQWTSHIGPSTLLNFAIVDSCESMHARTDIQRVMQARSAAHVLRHVRHVGRIAKHHHARTYSTQTQCAPQERTEEVIHV